MGYYAMPILWGEEIIGWANISASGDTDCGFVVSKPDRKEFTRAFDAEVSRMKTFLRETVRRPPSADRYSVPPGPEAL